MDTTVVIILIIGVIVVLAIAAYFMRQQGRNVEEWCEEARATELPAEQARRQADEQDPGRTRRPSI